MSEALSPSPYSACLGAFWNRGPAQGGSGTQGPASDKYPGGIWGSDDRLFIAVELKSGMIEIAAVWIDCDEDYFTVYDLSTGDTYDAWGPEDWSWWAYIPALPNKVLRDAVPTQPLTPQIHE